MTELEVCLDFACSCCCRPVELVVRCEGPVLTLTSKVLANVTIKCPNCGEPIDVTFDPEGAVYAVARPEAPRIPVPSLN